MGIVIMIIVIFLAVLGIGYYLYKLVKEEKNVFDEERKKQIEEEEKRTKNDITKIIKESNFEDLLKEAENDEEKLELLFISVRNDLKEAMRQKNTEKIKECNMKLKKLDLIEDKMKGN